MATKNQVLGKSWLGSERAGMEASPRIAAVRCAAAGQRAWGGRRPVNAGLLALSTLRGEVRRSLLGAWMHSGGQSAPFFTPDADSLVDFIAQQLPDPSPELALCRVEQLTLRAAYKAPAFEAPDPALLDAQCVVQRACHAGVVLFPGGSELILRRLLPLEALPADARESTPLLVAPGMQPLCRIASGREHDIWARLIRPAAVHTLRENGASRDAIGTIGTLLRIGALEYA